MFFSDFLPVICQKTAILGQKNGAPLGRGYAKNDGIPSIKKELKHFILAISKSY